MDATYPDPIWNLLEQLEPAGRKGLPVDDLPADVLKAAELAGLIGTFNHRPGPLHFGVVDGVAVGRASGDAVRSAGLTVAGVEALRARRCAAALAAIGGQSLTSAPAAGEPKPRVSLAEALRAAQRHVNAHGWPGSRRKLALICECSDATIRAAIEASSELRQAEAAHNLKNPKPSIEKNTPEHIAMVDETMRELLESLPANQRAELNTPKYRERLIAMTLDELSDLADTVRARTSAQ